MELWRIDHETKNQKNAFASCALCNNHRVINFNFEYIKSIDIPNFADQNFSYFFDIASDNIGGLYVTSNVLKPYNSKLIYLANNITLIDISKKFIGYVCYSDNNLYALDYIELNNINGKIIAESGKSEFYSINKNKLKSIAQLPYKHTFMDFEILDNHIFCINGAFHRLDVYDLQGNYIESLANLPVYDINSQYMTINKDTNTIFISVTNSGKIYKIEKIINK